MGVVKIIGLVKRGDLLVASAAPGAVIAQALEDFSGGQGFIRAMIRKF